MNAGELRAPMAVLDVDLDQDPATTFPARALVLARRKGIPVGSCVVEAGEGTAEVAARLAGSEPDLQRIPLAPRDLTVTVVITTCRDSLELRRTISDALSQSRPADRVLVVDNRPATSTVADVVEGWGEPRLGYVAAPLPGLARARNAGLHRTDTDLVAFTDDDVELDPDWLAHLVEAFDDSVDCVTGLLLPRALETRAQVLMEQFGGFAKGFEPRWFDLAEHRGDGPLYPFAVGAFGSGANAAFRTEALRSLGGFDDRLGTGRPTMGGEDLDIFLRLILSSRRIAYQPAALVWHHHETREREFRRRVLGYGTGLSVVLTKQLFSRTSRAAVLRRVRPGLVHLFSPASAKNERKDTDYPFRYTLLELYGVLLGPLALLRTTVADKVTGGRRPARRAGAERSLPLLTGAEPPLARRAGSRRTEAADTADTLIADRATAGMLRLPVWCTDVELSALPGTELTTPGDQRSVRALVRLHGEPLGYVVAPAENGRVAVADLLGDPSAPWRRRAVEHLTGDGVLGVEPTAESWPPAAAGCPTLLQEGPTVTVAVCTRDRGEELRRCLTSLAALEYPGLDLLIVDNASRSEATRLLVEEFAAADRRFRYVREDLPGLSRARNCALAAATGELLAFTDDDVEVDRRWVHGLVRGMAGSDTAACVTGLVCTADIPGPCELYFDTRVSWGDSCHREVFSPSRAQTDPLFPFSPGIFGTGANFAFRTSQLRLLGGFDAALGAGTRSAGGEDLDIFIRLIQAGYDIVYEPSAVVWHHHRASPDSLRRQMYAYGSGLSAVLAKQLLDPATRGQLLRRVPAGLRRLVRVPAQTRAPVAGVDVPVDTRTLLLREFLGMAAGPWLYWTGRAHARSVDAAALSSRPDDAAPAPAGPARPEPPSPRG